MRADAPPREVLVEAMSLFKAEGHRIDKAIDAGCGNGVETRYMLRHGVAAVYAFDIEPTAITRLLSTIHERDRARLHAEVAAFLDASWTPGADLVFAGYSLPFAEPAHFPQIWEHLVNSIAIGGRFVGHLFGDRDDWAQLANRTHHTRAEVEALLQPHFAVETLRELEWDKQLPSGRTKHWHVFEIIAKRVE